LTATFETGSKKRFARLRALPRPPLFRLRRDNPARLARSYGLLPEGMLNRALKAFCRVRLKLDIC